MKNNPVQPIFILPENTQRSSGKNAQKANIMAAKLVAEAVRTTLGPKGMDKMLVDSLGEVTITNDGVTILREMPIEHPTAKMIVEVARTQESEVGDGTTSAVVLAGELLKNAEKLLESNIHPTVLAKGYRMAAEEAIRMLNSIAKDVSSKDEDMLIAIAETAMTGKGAEANKQVLAKLMVEALYITKGSIRDIHVQKKTGGSAEDSELITGILLDKERVHSGMPISVKEAKIALLNCPFEVRTPDTDAKIQITDPLQLQAFVDQEEKMLKKMVDKLEESGANVLLCQKGIDDIAQYFLAKRGIYAVRRIRKTDVDALSKATGATIVNNIQELTEEDLGTAGIVEERKVGDMIMTFVTDCKHAQSVTLLLKGATQHVVDELKRAVDDALGDLGAALRTGKLVAGAGSPEMEVARALRKYGEGLSGREQLAVLAFADSMEIIPRTLAENAGLDPIDVLTALKSAHDKGSVWAGIDVFTGKVVDAWSHGVLEPLAVKVQAISSASEVAEMILRIDDVIAGGQPEKSSVPDFSQY
ncbi:TCP-1/cpn60 chaperonin family protein [Candidatus Woesearchaeota archaeon]|nr:TCP-1/cpn60 chaperonin family protein [Candidatus Woesearchaeota archaeon]